MGNYVFSTDALVEALRTDAGDEASVHDMGGSIIPMLGKDGGPGSTTSPTTTCPAPPSATGLLAGRRDHGRLLRRHMDLVAVHPVFNLYNREWPIFTNHPQLPPAKFVEGGLAQESIVGAGTISGRLDGPALGVFPGVTVLQGAYVEGSVLHARRPGSAGGGRPPGDSGQERAGPGRRAHRRRHGPGQQRYHVSDGGIVVLGKGELAQP